MLKELLNDLEKGNRVKEIVNAPNINAPNEEYLSQIQATQEQRYQAQLLAMSKRWGGGMLIGITE